MTDFIRFGTSWANEAKPVDAATLIDVVRNDLAHLRSEPATSIGYQLRGTLKTSNQTTYTDASTMWRSPRTIVHAGLAHSLVSMKFSIFAKVTAGNATYRVTASPLWKIVARPAVAPDAEILSGSGAITSTTGQLITVTLDLDLEQTLVKQYGAPLPAAGGVPPAYCACFFTIQAITNAGANTTTLMRVTRTEYSA